MAAAAESGDALKPFYERASEAELRPEIRDENTEVIARLSRLEAAIANKKDTGNEELLKKISDLQSKLDGANAELASEREKAHKLAVENAKLQYRIVHLVHAVRESDAKLEKSADGAEASDQTTTKLNSLQL